jgi:amino acid transporter
MFKKEDAEYLDSPGAVADADEAQGGLEIVDGGISLDRDAQLQRGLKSRHIQFLALGGA